MTVIPRLDKKSVTEAAAAAVTAVEDDHPSDHVARLRAVSALSNAHAAEAADLRPLRDAMSLSLAFYAGFRTLQNTMGITRTRFYEMRCEALGLTPDERREKWLEGPDGEDRAARKARIVARARQHKVAEYSSATPARLLEVSQRVVYGDAVATIARERRDAMVLDLIEAGWSRPRIAEVIGRTVTRVTRIKANQTRPVSAA